MTTPPPPPGKGITRRRWAWLAALSAVVLIGAGLGIGLAVGSSDSAPGEAADSTTTSTTTAEVATTATTTTTIPPATTTTTSSTTTTTTSTTTTTTTTTTTAPPPPRGPVLLDNYRTVVDGPAEVLWIPDDGPTPLIAWVEDDEFSINIDWWMESSIEPGYEGCSVGDPGEYVADPVGLDVLTLATGWYGCSHPGDMVVQLRLHTVFANAVELEWWIWDRP